MLLAREFVSYLSRQIVRKLTPQILETPNPQGVADIIDQIITEELTIEDRLNDEVRDILGQYSDYMRRRLVMKWKPSTMILASAAAGALILLRATQFTAGAGIAITGFSFAGIYPVTLGFAGSRFEAYSVSVFGILFAIALVGMILPWAVWQFAQIHGLRAALAIVIGNCVMIFLLQLAISARTGSGT